MRLENPREGLKNSVPRIVPVGIVDFLEQIQVSHHNPKGKVVPSGCTEFT